MYLTTHRFLRQFSTQRFPSVQSRNSANFLFLIVLCVIEWKCRKKERKKERKGEKKWKSLFSVNSSLELCNNVVGPILGFSFLLPGNETMIEEAADALVRDCCLLNTQIVADDDEQHEVTFNGWWNMILLTVFPHFVVFFKSVAAPWLAIRWQKFCKSISCTASCAHSVVITGVKRKGIWSIQLEWKKKEWPFFFFWLLRMLITIFSLFGFDSFFFVFFFLLLLLFSLCVVGRL